MTRLVLFILFIFNSLSSFACLQKSQACIEGPQTKVIEGKLVTRDCWKYETKFECLGDDYKDYCSSIRATPGCVQLSSDCKEYGQDRKCLEYKDTFQCGSLLKTNTDVVYLDSDYSIKTDELDAKQCSENELSDNCYISEEKCVEGASTKNINGKDVYKDCWKYERKYNCLSGSYISDCDEYNKCKLVKEVCLSQNKKGECAHKEKHFECLDLERQSPIYMNCKHAKYCIGGSCDEISYKPNQNMNRSIAALSMLNGIRKDFESEGCSEGNKANCKVFKGDANYCAINPVSSLNCCKDNGWLKGLKLAKCNEEEKQLAKRKEAKLCHHVGSYCDDRVLGICLSKRQSYCCFQSKLSRIIQEQGRGQLGISWGSAESPDCRSLTIEELQRINFDKVDLTEIYGDFLGKVGEYNHESRQKTTTAQTKQTIDNKLKEAGAVAGTKVTNSEYQEEIARRVKQHYGN